jgi:hypothetical protein
MSFQQANNIGYGFSQSLLNIFPRPIVSTRAPATTDRAQIGSVWVNTATNNAYILTSIVANVSTWESITGGAGSFSSLTVTPGPVSLTGTTTINTTGAATTSIGSTTGASGITMAVGTGNFSLTGASSSTYGIATGTGNSVVTIGSTGASAATTIQGSLITLSAGGAVRVVTANTSTSSASATLNARAGLAVFTGFTTAAAGTQAFTVTNSTVTASSAILVTVANTGTNAAYMTMQNVVPGAGSFVVNTINNGAATLNGNVNITFWVIN